ncbi:MAG: LPS assembly protein LptD [Acidobacteriota bacterium]|nr:LPS assembly protein LptD [Acidobacteriota bacterium]MDE3266610.1 LPS assembly protein LptD [Acidobacteriota bacterium]
MSSADQPVAALLLALTVTAAAAAQEPETAPATLEDAPPAVEEPASDAAEAAAEEPADTGPPPPPGANTFSFAIEDESGPGRVEGWAGAMAGTSEEKHTLSNGFWIRLRDYQVSGDRAVYDQANERFEADGPVVLTRGNEVMRGSRLEVDVAAETASIFDADGNVGTDYFFTGAAVHMLSEDRFTILDAQFTACEVGDDGRAPDWSFRAKRVDVNANGYAKTRGVSFRTRRVPLVYLPYMLWPVQSSRVSGFLTPKPGFSTRRGPSLGLAYYWAINRSYDATFNVDLYAGAPSGSTQAFSTEPFWGLGTEFRYRPTEGTGGDFDGYLIDDTERGERRWRMRWNHQSRDLPGGFRGVVRFEDVSDFDFFRDFERRVDRNTLRQLYSTAFVSRNWGNQSLNVQLDQRKTFISANREVQLRQLPEIEYKLRSTRLGRSPLYLQLRSSLHYLDVSRSARRQGQYARANLLPEISIPVPLTSWLSLSLTAGGQLTWYGDSLLTAEERRMTVTESDFRGEDLLRVVPTARAEIVGPGFSRIFELGEGGRFSRLKHVIEPRIAYGYFRDFDERLRIPLFDEIDNLRGRNVARVSLFNRVLAKPADPNAGGAFEILSVQFFRDISLDADRPLLRSLDRSLTSQNGPVGALLRFNPSRRTGVRFDALYDTLFSQVSSTAISGSLGLSRTSSVGLRWAVRRNPELDRTRRHHAQVSAGLDLIPGKLRVNSMLSYDIEQKILQIQRHVVDFRACCYGLQFEIADFRTALRRDTQYRLLVTLKSVGAFFDITGGQSEAL